MKLLYNFPLKLRCLVPGAFLLWGKKGASFQVRVLVGFRGAMFFVQLVSKGHGLLKRYVLLFLFSRKCLSHASTTLTSEMLTFFSQDGTAL